MTGKEKKETGPVPGGGPREGEEAQIAPNPNPDAVHPDLIQTIPGGATPPSAAESADAREADVNKTDSTEQ